MFGAQEIYANFPSGGSFREWRLSFGVSPTLNISSKNCFADRQHRILIMDNNDKFIFKTS